VNTPSAEDQVRFLSNLQRLLAEGQFVATYKYALLLALADLAVEQGDDTDATLKIPTALIAEKFIHYYWRQTVPYVARQAGRSASRILRQNTGRQAEVVRRLDEIRSRVGQSLVGLKQDQRRWRSLVRAIEKVVVVMPLWKLQTVGRQPLEFLYGRSAEMGFVELKPGVAYCLRKFHDLVTDLVRGAWARYIRRVNSDVLEINVDLNEFLFGSERANLLTVQPVLQEIQHGKCFYCNGAINRGAAHVDHFIPWSRYPVDLGHNFVLAHGACNSSKGDRLAAVDHLQAWVERNRGYGSQLDAEFKRRDMVADLDSTRQIAQWAYSQTWQAHGLTWVRGDNLVSLPDGWETILAEDATSA
jgi:5-methylcytosine-specific restriction endonuclease McrA